jgi:hypothetical protein
MAQKRITDLPAATSIAATDVVLAFQDGQAKQATVDLFGAGLTFDASAIVSGILPVVRGGTGVATSTGTGSTVLSTSPTLVTPALGTPTALVGTNITGTAAGLSIGGNAATVTTNANLTGHVTSTGNAAVLGSFTVAQLNTAISDGDVATGGGTATGTNTGDQTNITGNAATVTTNANLTGDVTSVGNATTLTNAAVIAKVLTGYTSGAGTVAATDTILQAIQKLNGNDATRETSANKDATGGYAGLTLFKLNLKNAANTFTNFFTNATTAARTWTLPDKDGTVAMTSDIGSAAWVIKTTTYTAVTGDYLMADTTSAAFTITLPATPSANHVVNIADYAGTFATNNLTIGRNSSKIMSLSEDMVISTNNISITLTYIDSTVGWKLT